MATKGSFSDGEDERRPYCLQVWYEQEGQESKMSGVDLHVGDAMVL